MTKAELKRRLIPGTKLTLVNTLLGPCNKPRTVLDVRSRGYVMLTPEGKHSHLDIVPGEEIHETPNGFQVVVLASPASAQRSYAEPERIGAEYVWGWPND